MGVIRIRDNRIELMTEKWDQIQGNELPGFYCNLFQVIISKKLKNCTNFDM